MADATRDPASDPALNGSAPTSEPARPQGPLHEFVAWLNPEQADQVPAYVPILRAPGSGAKLRGVVLSQKAEAVLVHWVAGRTSPCLGGPLRCHGCRTTQPKKRVGYLGADVSGEGLCLLELSPRVIDTGIHLLKATAKLRGLGFVYGRSEHTRGRRCVLDLTTQAAELAPTFVLKPEPDIRTILLRLWGLR